MNEQGLIERYRAALAFHNAKHLQEAYQAYWGILRDDPPQTPTPSQVALALRHAPRLFVTPTEPFPLQDAAAILHPEEPLIAYHLFWEDDIDFPDDQEPCDHEVIWVRYAEGGVVTMVYAYYHDFVLESPLAVEEAIAFGGRPHVDVQWGKHGSLPYGWRELYEGWVLKDMRATYERLHTQGRREQGNPLAHRWPRRFAGSWEEFIDFGVEVDLPALLRQNEMLMVSRWANAVINTHFLRYNFHPKTDWPV